MLRGYRDPPQHCRHVQPNRAAPPQRDEPADHQIAKKSEVQDDRNDDHDVIHR
jgi:hypothetical protein